MEFRTASALACNACVYWNFIEGTAAGVAFFATAFAAGLGVCLDAGFLALGVDLLAVVVIGLFSWGCIRSTMRRTC
jgi:hypothetical protein